MVKNRRQIAITLLQATVCVVLLVSGRVTAAGPEFTVWGYVTYDSAQGPPVPQVVVRCNTITNGVQDGTPPGEPGVDGRYTIEFERVAEQLRIYLEIPSDMEVIGNSTRIPCGPWGVDLVVCNIPKGQAAYNIGPVNFFVRYLAPSTSTPTATLALVPTRTKTPTQTGTEAASSTPTQTSTVRPEGRPTPDTFLAVQQRKLEQTDEFLGIFRFFVYSVVGALAAGGYVTTRSKRS